MPAIDMRSDTVTRPTQPMRRAMAEAEVGDDVFGDDPSVNRLQERSAELLGKEAALFVPSGTMANQVAIRTHTEPGDEIIVEAGSHIFLYEGGGPAAISGVSVRTVAADRGLLSAEQVSDAVRPPGGLSHFPHTKMVCLENTANRGGGTVYGLEQVQAISNVARDQGLRLHLDGARMFNAVAALGCSPADIARPFDSISFCLSKGLGCPVGSLLVGSVAFVARAHRFRKMLGGGMRQAGILAAAGLYALDHNVERMVDDHRRARELGEAMAAVDGCSVDLAAVETNMVYVDVAGTGLAADAFCEGLQEQGVLTHAINPTVLRFVTHLEIDDSDIAATASAFASVAARG
jgi:threonine aldolase